MNTCNNQATVGFSIFRKYRKMSITTFVVLKVISVPTLLSRQERLIIYVTLE